MPYRLEKRGDKWCVVGPNRTHGCHDSRAKAIKQQRALYVNAPESADGGVTMTVVKERTGTSGVDSSGSPWNVVDAGALGNGRSDLAVSTTADTSVGEAREPWAGILGIEGHPTGDGRLLLVGEIGERDLPVPFRVQPADTEGHEGALSAGSIEGIEHVPLGEFKTRPESEEFDLEDVREDSVIIWGTGTTDGSEAADMAKRLIKNGAGVSLDGLRFTGSLHDPETLAEIDQSELDAGAVFEKLFKGEVLQGVAGKIAAVTVVDMAAFEEAKVRVMTASGQLRMGSTDGRKLWYYVGPTQALTAAAGPLKPPREWFEDPRLSELTPLQITPDGRVFGHLADWDGCHVGFQGVCVPPFRSQTNYAYFNTGGIETAEGDIIPCGKIMFCRKGNGHAPLHLGIEEAGRYYDDSTKVGAFVRAGEDRFGTWLAGSLRSDLTDLEIQHLRTHNPSGDWRPYKHSAELIAAFAVPIGGFPMSRKALVASADDQISAIITAPLQLTEEMGYRRRKRKKMILSQRLRQALGPRVSPRTQMRQDALARRSE